jgi:hypothetical protein
MKPIILEKLKVADILDASISVPLKGETEERLSYLVLYEKQPIEAAIWLDYYELPKNVDPFDAGRNWTYMKKNLEEMQSGKKVVDWGTNLSFIPFIFISLLPRDSILTH